MQNYKQIAAALVATAAFSLPLAASAETNASAGISADVQAQVQTLLSQIKALQNQIKTLVGSSSPGLGEWMQSGGMNPGQLGKIACITLKRNIRQGDAGEDVKKLQDLLMQHPETGFTASSTGFFGPMTMRAMAKFQLKMGIASSSDGSVGPITRGFFERNCGQGLGGAQGQGKIPGDIKLGGILRGSVSAVSASSITVQTDDASVVVNVTSSTEIKVFGGTSTPPTAGTLADIAVGKKVMVGGEKYPDGSINAMNIAVGEILPLMRIEGAIPGHGSLQVQGFPMPPFGQGQGGPGKPVHQGSIVPGGPGNSISW